MVCHRARAASTFLLEHAFHALGQRALRRHRRRGERAARARRHQRRLEDISPAGPQPVHKLQRAPAANCIIIAQILHFSHCCQVVLQIAPVQSGFQSENGRPLCNPQSMHAHARTRTQTPPCAQDVPTVLLTRPFATRTELGWANVCAGGPAGGIGGSKLRIYELRLV